MVGIFMKENGVGKESGINIDTSIDFASMSSAFIGGTGDFVTLFEPNALEIEKQGKTKLIKIKILIGNQHRIFVVKE